MTAITMARSDIRYRLGVHTTHARIFRLLISKLLPYAAALLLWGCIWYASARAIGIELILPSPAATWRKLCEIVPTEKFLTAALSSMRRVLTGFAVGALFGTLVALISFFLPFAETFFSPFLKTVRATPVSSFILIAVLWMNADTVPTFISFLMVLPIVSGNVLTGLKNTSTRLTEAARMYDLSFFTRLRILYIPAALPYFGTSCSTALGLAWKAGIAAEVLCVTAGSIGKNLYTSKLYFESAELFAWTVSVVLLSILLEAAGAITIHAVKKLHDHRYKA